MLEGDISSQSNSADLMLENAQNLPSQYSDSAVTSDIEFEGERIGGFLDRWETEITITESTEEPSVILIEDDNAESEIISDTTNDASTDLDQPVPVDLRKSSSTTVPSEMSPSSISLARNGNIETSFDREFVGGQNNDKKIVWSLFDNDLDINNANIAFKNSATNQEKPSTSKAAAQVKEKCTSSKFFTQMEAPPKRRQPTCHNVSASCPETLDDGQNPNFTNPSLNFERRNLAKQNADGNIGDMLLSFNSAKDSSFNMSKSVPDHKESTLMSNSQQNDEQREQYSPADAENSTLTTSEDTENDSNIQLSHLLQPTIPFPSDASAIPESIKRLFDLMKTHYSDLTFVYALSAQLCQDRVPMVCYVNVKMALLLSIASCAKNPNVAPIPIIVMGNDTYMANFLMMNIADLAERFVGPCDDVKSMPSSDGYRNYNWIEADPIQLAKGGVYYVGDWACLRSARSEKIFKDIETARVAVERTTRIYPLQTAIWAHWRAFKYNAKDQQLFNKFVKVFGIPICMDSRNQETLVNYMLKQASTEIFESTVDHLSVSADDMRQFLATISQRTVDSSPEALNLLRKYFVASRNERPDCLTKEAYSVMKQLAESFAKLSLRHEVLIIDAVGAISMCENFLQHLYGPGMDPPPMLEEGNFVGDIDKHVARFHEWLQSYIVKYCEKDT